MKNWTILYALTSVVLLLWIEQVLEVSYLWKTAAKVLLFLAIPFLFLQGKKFNFLHLRKTQKKNIHIAIVVGFAVMMTILGAFIILRSLIDLPSLQMDLESRVGVTASVFPMVAIYILIVNSFLEEFYFRGLLVDFLKDSKLKWFLPSFFFAIYHVAIFLPWFEWPILTVAVVGLFIGGLLFQWINEASGTIYPSWIIHMFADLGILLIGVYMFYY